MAIKRAIKMMTTMILATTSDKNERESSQNIRCRKWMILKSRN
jgi:hypothetical protein